MNKGLFFVYFVGLVHISSGQAITTAIEDITTRWDEEAELLSTYEGLRTFCEDDQFRYAMIQTLRDIHKYDSILYGKLLDAQRYGYGNHRVDKTIKEIEKFEKKYTMKGFLIFLYQDCKASKSLEKNADDLRKDHGDGWSYDNQVYVLEVELGRYVHHITKRVDQIREHIHHLYN
ncbi:MAG: hypothetical protein AAGA85_02950 [Bacteroidota bacterium]